MKGEPGRHSVPTTNLAVWMVLPLREETGTEVPWAHGLAPALNQRQEQKRDRRRVHPSPGRSREQHAAVQYGSEQSLAEEEGTHSHRRRSPHLPRRDLPSSCRRGPPARALTPVKTRPAAPLMPHLQEPRPPKKNPSRTRRGRQANSSGKYG
jgi:hypothetical protein